MRFTTAAAAALLLPVGFALAQNATGQTHIVMVGAGGQKAYSPPNITAAEGDVVQFQFVGGNHTATQSSFANPCANLTNPDGSTGVDSGFQFVNTSSGMIPTWSIGVNNVSTPLWFYCRQTGHCELGMVFSINANAEKTFAQFQANALGTNTTANTTAPASSSASGSATASATDLGSGSATAGTATDGPTPSPSVSTTSGALSVRMGSAAGLLLSTALLAVAFL